MAPGPSRRLELVAYRTDRATPADLVGAFESLRSQLLNRRVVLESHLTTTGGAAFVVECPPNAIRGVTAALRGAYPNLRLRASHVAPDPADGC